MDFLSRFPELAIHSLYQVVRVTTGTQHTLKLIHSHKNTKFKEETEISWYLPPPSLPPSLPKC
jgi:hypothetical protein